MPNNIVLQAMILPVVAEHYQHIYRRMNLLVISSALSQID